MVDTFDLSKDPVERARLCRCGHTRGNHRWFGIGGRHACYDEDKDTRCACQDFAPAEATEATNGEAVGYRPFSDLRSSGLLWLINRIVFHPRGLALALHVEKGDALGWSLIGDGKECWTFKEADDDEGFANSNRTIEEHLSEFDK